MADANLTQPEIWNHLLDFIKNLGNGALPFLGAMAAVGALSMAIIQAVKDVFSLRKRYQRWKLNHWLEAKADKLGECGKPRPDVTKAKEDLIRNATAGDEDAFYDLPIEQLCGQMNAAVQTVLDFPEKHQDLLRCLAAKADSEDIDLLLTQPQAAKAGQPKSQELVNARTRVIHQVQRAIDGFQIAASYRWKWSLQVAAIVLSFCLIIIGFWKLLPNYDINLGDSWPFVIVAALLGGVLAPVARDLIAAIQKLRA